MTVQVVAADDGNTYSQTFTDIVQLDVAALKNTTASLQKHGLKIKKQNGNSISGEIILDNGQNQIMTLFHMMRGGQYILMGKKQTIQNMQAHLSNLTVHQESIP